MKAKVISLLIGSCALTALAAEPTAEQEKERFEHGTCSQADVLTAQENALLKELIGNRELPEIQVEGDNPLEAYLQVLMAQGAVSQEDTQKAQEEWLHILQIGAVLRELPPGDKLTALQKNLMEQLQLAHEKADAGVGNKLELLITTAKLAAWFNTH